MSEYRPPLTFAPEHPSAFAIACTVDLARAVQSVCMGRADDTRMLTMDRGCLVEGTIPVDILDVVRGIHRFVGDGLNGRRTCGFVMVYQGIGSGMGAKTVLRWEHKNGKWSVKYKNGRFTAIGKDVSMKVALDNLFVAFKPSPLTDKLGRATVVA